MMLPQRSVQILLFALLTASCSEANDELPVEQEDLLANGKLAEPGDVPAALGLSLTNKQEGGDSNCSATRIGPNLILTAAHCVTVGVDHAFVFRGREQAVPNAETEFLFAPGMVKCRSEHSSELDRERHCYSSGSSDMAVIRTSIPLPDSIAIADVDTRPVTAGEVLTLAGIGIHNTESGALKFDGRLRFGLNYVIPKSWFPRARFSAALMAVIPNSPTHFLMPVQLDSSGTGMGVGIQKGDSGGGAFRLVAGKLRVVGVHSFVLDNGRGSLLSGEAIFDSEVATWLKSLGVSGRPSPAETLRTCAAGFTRDASLKTCVRDSDGIATTARLSAEVRAICAEEKLKSPRDRPPELNHETKCDQRGFPVTLLHRWIEGL